MRMNLHCSVVSIIVRLQKRGIAANYISPLTCLCIFYRSQHVISIYNNLVSVIDPTRRINKFLVTIKRSIGACQQYDH